MMQEVKKIQYQRAVVPEDADNLDIQTLDLGDASENIACAAIYVRFKRKNGLYSCKLIFARSRMSEEPTQPRGELVAALLKTYTGQTVKQSAKLELFGNFYPAKNYC